MQSTKNVNNSRGRKKQRKTRAKQKCMSARFVPGFQRKKNFFEALKKIPKNVATKLEGGKALVAGPLKKELYFFCGFPNITHNISVGWPRVLGHWMRHQGPPWRVHQVPT